MRQQQDVCTTDSMHVHVAGTVQKSAALWEGHTLVCSMCLFVPDLSAAYTKIGIYIKTVTANQC